jgi:hypothetical protein
MDLSDSEEQLIKILRNMKPYERIEIMADAEGKPDVYMVLQSSKRMVFPKKQVFMQVRSNFVI